MSGKAIKFDGEKPRMELLPMEALEEISKVLTFGAKKYTTQGENGEIDGANNWRLGFAWGRLQGSLLRHMSKFQQGEDIDPESGLPHLAHAGCCILFLLSHQLNGYGTDDRFSTFMKEQDKEC